MRRCSDHNTIRRIGSPAVTLVEVMIGIVLMGVVALGSAGFFAHSMGMVDDSQASRAAFEQAKSALDKLRSGSYEDVVADSTGEDLVVDGRSYKLITEVTEPAGRDGRYKEVKVRVTWSKGSRSFEVSLASLVADAGRPE